MAMSYAGGNIYALGFYIGDFLTALPITNPSLVMPTTTPIPYNATILASRCASSTLQQVQTFGMGNKVVISCVVCDYLFFILLVVVDSQHN
jgi:hypothetical protein